MDLFSLYFSLGVEHILDFEGYDHMLFIMALCVLYSFKDWKKLLILVTAFTLGHSLTLALATFHVLEISPQVVEFLIPLTIIITCIANLFSPDPPLKVQRLKYFFAMFFGLIHGLGFSGYLRSLLGNEQNIVQPLLAFNLGIEIGQIGIVVLFMLFTQILIRYFSIAKRDLVLVISSIIAGISLTLLFEAKFW